MAAAAVVRRLFPGTGIKAYKQLAGGAWWQYSSKWATATAIVTTNTGGASRYMLTVGHAFRDSDGNSNRDLGPAHVNNILFPGPLPADQPPISWGEDMRLAPRPFVPFANSSGQYHCAGDKLNSNFDAGLALLDPGLAAGTWDNIYRANNIDVTLNAFDAWPPVLPPGEQYFIGNYQVQAGAGPADLHHRDTLTTNFQRYIPSAPPAILNRVMVTTTDHNTNPGVSGKPLIRMPVPNHTGQATLVGLLVGKTTDAAVPGNNALYETYQHISEVQNQLNLAGLA